MKQNQSIHYNLQVTTLLSKKNYENEHYSSYNTGIRHTFFQNHKKKRKKVGDGSGHWGGRDSINY